MTRADRVIAFIERLKITIGDDAGKPFKLRPWQQAFIRAVYDPVNDAGRRTVRRAVLSIARKNGKTELAAALVLVHLIGPEAEPNGEIYSAANDREQASIVFGAVKRMIEATPALQRFLSVVPSTKHIFVKRTDIIAAGSKFKALSADANTKHGLNPSFVIYDELAQAKNRELFDTLTTSQGARSQPLFLTISTQNNDPNHVLSQMIDDGLAGHDPSTVCHLYAADDDCELLDVDQWHKANPALGDFRSLEDLRVMAERAARLPAEEQAFRLLYLNQRVSLTANLISAADWKACRDPNASLQEGEEIVLALDMSKRTDLTALVGVSLTDEARVESWFWKPRALLAEHERSDRVPYAQWARDGHLELVEGRSIDPMAVALKVAELTQSYRVKALVYDRWGMDELLRVFDQIGLRAQEGEGDGLRLVPFGQGYRDMSPAVEAFEMAVINGDLKHAGNPLLTQAVMNAHATSDPAGNRKLDKTASRFRIDGAVALAMACGFKARDREAPQPIDPWADPNFTILT